jgi:hypothetical protein
VSPLFGSAKATDSTNEAAAEDRAAVNGGPPASAVSARIQGVSGLATSRPELIVAAAFAGGVALAILARRLGR